MIYKKLTSFLPSFIPSSPLSLFPSLPPSFLPLLIWYIPDSSMLQNIILNINSITSLIASVTPSCLSKSDSDHFFSLLLLKLFLFPVVGSRTEVAQFWPVGYKERFATGSRGNSQESVQGCPPRSQV